jgi:hypothetical protein
MGSANQEMQHRLSQAKLIAAFKAAGLSGRKANAVVVSAQQDGAVDGSQIFDKKYVPFPPDAGVPPRDFGLPVEFRKIYLRKDVRLRITSPNVIYFLLQKKRCVEFGRSSDDEFRCRSCRLKLCAGANHRLRLALPAMCAENVIRCNSPAAESAIDHLHGYGLAAE